MGGTDVSARAYHVRAGLLPPRGRETLLLMFAVELRYHQYTSAFFSFIVGEALK